VSLARTHVEQVRWQAETKASQQSRLQ
jgi:hypothetical protein